jgi:hypothetical protein
MSQQNINWQLDFLNHDLNPDDCTCIECSEAKTCQFAFDFYNIDGDCLMEK